MQEKINEKVDVITIFRRFKRVEERAFPYKIKWNGRDHIIKKIGYCHRIKIGTIIHHIFSVSSDTLAFRLDFDTESLLWTLQEVSDGSAA